MTKCAREEAGRARVMARPPAHVPLVLLVLGGVLAPRSGEGISAAAAQRRAAPPALPISATPPPLSPLQSTLCGGVSPSGRRLPSPTVPPPLTLADADPARAKRGKQRGSTAARGVSLRSHRRRLRVRLPSTFDRSRSCSASLSLFCLCRAKTSGVPPCGVDGCTKLPYFGPRNTRALRCHKHSVAGDVNVRAKRRATRKVRTAAVCSDFVQAGRVRLGHRSGAARSTTTSHLRATGVAYCRSYLP